MKTMYMHTLDGKPASFHAYLGYAYLSFSSNGNRARAARLVPSLSQIRREHQACLRNDWQDWNVMDPNKRGDRPTLKRYGYVLVLVPDGRG